MHRSHGFYEHMGDARADGCPETPTTGRQPPHSRAAPFPGRHDAGACHRNPQRGGRPPCPQSNLPILVVMEELPLADVRNRLSELVADVEKTHARVTITKHGHPAAVLIAPEDLASMEETLDILSDPHALAAIREAEAEAARGEFITAEEMARLMEERQSRESGAA